MQAKKLSSHIPRKRHKEAQPTEIIAAAIELWIERVFTATYLAPLTEDQS